MTESKKTLNQKIAELDANVEWFYSDEFNLDQAVANYKKATQLAREIEDDLNSLKKRN